MPHSARWVPRWLVLLLLLTIIAPFLVTELPPLVDLPGHMGRYHIAAAIDRSPDLARYYAYEWFLTPNLGVDLIVHALRDIVDVEQATWAMPLITVVLLFAGILWISREVHGAVQPTALLALPFVYSHMFLFGFLNYFLSVGLALLGFALWLRLGSRPAWRAPVLLVVASAVWLCHLVGWAVLAVLIGVHALWQGYRCRGGTRWRIVRSTAAAVWPLLPPALFTLLLGRHAEGTLFENPPALLFHKMLMTALVISDQWFPLDVATLVVIAGIVAYGVRSKSIVVVPAVTLGGIALLACFVLLPAVALGSYYADSRLLPVALIACLLGLAWRGDGTAGRAVVAVATAIILLRLSLTTLGWAEADRAYRSHLAGLDRVPFGARILVQAVKDCTVRPRQYRPPIDHLGSMAIVRRNAFTNTQWQNPGAHGVTAIYNRDTPFFGDPSHFASASDCPGAKAGRLSDRLARFPRDRFDYVWILRTTLNAPVVPPDLRIAYADADSLLLEVIR